jgi:hypothetical protein
LVGLFLGLDPNTPALDAANQRTSTRWPTWIGAL